jgi:hypothetical protein
MISRRDYFIMDGACKEQRAPKPATAGKAAEL